VIYTVSWCYGEAYDQYTVEAADFDELFTNELTDWLGSTSEVYVTDESGQVVWTLPDDMSVVKFPENQPPSSSVPNVSATAAFAGLLAAGLGAVCVMVLIVVLLVQHPALVLAVPTLALIRRLAGRRRRN
jgi:hypothetical protein